LSHLQRKENTGENNSELLVVVVLLLVVLLLLLLVVVVVVQSCDSDSESISPQRPAGHSALHPI